jgi:hypothetical protein
MGFGLFQRTRLPTIDSFMASFGCQLLVDWCGPKLERRGSHLNTPVDIREKSIQDIERQKRRHPHVGQIDDLTDTKVDGDARQNVSLFSRKAIFLRQ